jgi:hypothetical protein
MCYPTDYAAHSISLASPYGEAMASECVAEPEFAAALRRIYNQAMEHPNAVIVLDGVMQTRNTFLEFVREFNDCAARSSSARTH